MPPAMFRPAVKPLSGRHLFMVERKEIALLLVQDHSLQEIGRRLGRSASTISREVRRNATTRGWSGISCDRRPVACQAVCRSAEGDEACRERRLAFLCGKTGSPTLCAPSAAARFPGPPYHGKGVGMGRDRIDDGRRHGVQNKSPDALPSTSRMTRRCASATKPSTRRPSYKAAAPCDADLYQSSVIVTWRGLSEAPRFDSRWQTVGVCHNNSASVRL